MRTDLRIKPTIAHRDGQDYVLEQYRCNKGIETIWHRIIVIPATRREDDLLNYAAVAQYLDCAVRTIRQRQLRGWIGNDGNPLGTVPRVITTPDSMLLIRRGDVDRVTKRDLAGQTADRFLVDGSWWLTKSAAAAKLGRGQGGTSFNRECEKWGLDRKFKQMDSPITGQPVHACPEKEVLAIVKRLRSRRKAPPRLNGRRTHWLLKLRRDIRKLKQGRADASFEMCMRWINEGCAYLDGDKLRAGRLEDGRRDWFVDRGQAVAILKRMRALIAGKECGLLRQHQVIKEYGISDHLLLKAEGAGRLHPHRDGDDGPNAIYSRLEVESLERDLGAQDEWQPRHGCHLPGWFAKRLGLKRSFTAWEDVATIHSVLAKGVRAGQVDCDQHPKGLLPCYFDETSGLRYLEEVKIRDRFKRKYHAARRNALCRRLRLLWGWSDSSIRDWIWKNCPEFKDDVNERKKGVWAVRDGIEGASKAKAKKDARRRQRAKSTGGQSVNSNGPSHVDRGVNFKLVREVPLPVVCRTKRDNVQEAALRSVLCAIDEYCGTNSSCTISIKRLGDTTNLSESTVRRALLALGSDAIALDLISHGRISGDALRDALGRQPLKLIAVARKYDGPRGGRSDSEYQILFGTLTALIRAANGGTGSAKLPG